MDRSPSTVTAVSGLMDALSQLMGPDATATRVLPVLCPLLVVHALNGRQFKEVMSVMQVCDCVLASSRFWCACIKVLLARFESESTISSVIILCHCEGMGAWCCLRQGFWYTRFGILLVPPPPWMSQMWDVSRMRTSHAPCTMD